MGIEDEHLEEDFKKVVHRILLRDIIVLPVKKIGEKERFFLIEKIFRESKIKHLPVVDKEDHLVGIIAMADLYRTVSPRKDHETGTTYLYDPAQFEEFKLKDHMTKNPFTLNQLNSNDSKSRMPFKAGYIQMNFKKVVRHAEIEDFRFHNLRHCFAS